MQLRGVSRTYAVLKNLKLASGRWFLNDGEVVLDANAVAEFFPKTEPHTVVGQSVVLGTTVWKVVGVLEASKAGFQDSSLIAYLDVDQLRSRLQRGKGVSSLTLGVSDVHTRNSDTFKATVSSTLSTMTLFVSAIALISLVVGGVGVMNIMLVSVTERTREIGVRLAVGARKKDILQQFLLEAMLLCTAGGLLGVSLSAMLAGAYNSVVHQFPMSIDPAVAAAAVLFSTCLGLAFGIMPARKAASTVPVDALNHS